MSAEMAAVVAWLRSPAGERWSRERIAAARAANGAPPPSAYTVHGERNLAVAEGFFSVRLG